MEIEVTKYHEFLFLIKMEEYLLDAGLIGVDITMEELLLADALGNTYSSLTVQDRIVLAIARKFQKLIMSFAAGRDSLDLG